MFSKLIIAGLFAGVAAFASGAVVLQEDFTASQNGTLPGSLSASYDAGVDVIVVPLATMQPTPVTDHTGGDGYVCRVGDIGSSGGGYNWIYLASPSPQADARVSGWVYVDWTTLDATPLERDYLILGRMQNTDPQVSPTRQAYFFGVTAYSSWTGISPNPTNFRPVLFVKSGTSHTLIQEGSSDVTTGWHFFELEMSGSSIVGKVDGTTVVSGTNTTYGSGNAAWGYYDDNGSASSYPFAAAWDNIKYETLGASAVTDWTLYE
ncbi:MAG: hypothetical protein ACP5QZ_11740 [Candidatus Sumerlaeaceae bacterium]